MYTVSKGPNKIVAKTRRGLAPSYEKFETIREISKKGPDVGRVEDFSVPRPVFQTNKRALFYNKTQSDDEALTPQHEEIVKYITESWNMVVAQNPYDSPVPQERKSENGPPNSSLYCVEPPSPVLTDFKPFDLESWWGRRLFNNITKSL